MGHAQIDLELELGKTKEGQIGQTWVCRFCHLACCGYFLARNGESKQMEGKFQDTLSV